MGTVERLPTHASLFCRFKKRLASSVLSGYAGYETQRSAYMRAVFLFALLIALPDRPDISPREKPRLPHEALIGDWAYISSTADGVGEGNLQSIWRVTPSDAVWLAGGSP